DGDIGSGGGGGSPPSEDTIAPNQPDGGDEYDNVDEFQDSGGGGGGSSSPSRDTIAPSRPDSSGGSSSPRSSDTKSVIEQSAENIVRNSKDFEDLSIQEIKDIQESTPEVTKRLNEGLTDALSARRQNLESKKQASEAIENIESAPSDAVFRTESGEQLSKTEALTRAREDRSRINEVIREQEEAAVNVRRANQQASMSRQDRIEQRAAQIEFNPDNEAFTETGEFLADASERVVAYTDTAFSSKGGELLASFVTDKSPDTVVEERVAELQIDQETSNPDINILDTSRLSSPPALFVGGGVGGAGFRTVGKGIGQVSSKGQTLYRAGGAAVGGAATVKEAQNVKDLLNEGETTRALGRTIDFASISAGFAGGAKAASNRLGPRKGNTEIEQLQVIKPGDPLTGRGRFKAQTNIIDTQFRNPVSRDGLKINVRSPLETVTRAQETSGRFGILNDQAQGTFNTITPSGKARSGQFQAISIPKVSGRTSSGQRVEIRGDITRSQTEGRFFRNTRDNQGRTKNIRSNQRESDADEVLASFDNIALNKDQNVRAVDILSVSRDGQTNFGETTTFVLGRGKSGGAGSRSGSGQGQSGSGLGSGSGQTSVQSGQSRIGSNIKDLSSDLSGQIRNVASREASRTVSNQRDSSLTTLQSSEEASTTEMGRGSGADVATFEGNIESSGEFDRQTVNQDQGAVQETSQDQSLETAESLKISTDRPGLREKSRQLLDLDSQQDSLQEQGRVSLPDQVLEQGQDKVLGQIPRTRQSVRQRVNERLGLKNIQLNPPRQRQRFRNKAVAAQTNLNIQSFASPTVINPGLSGRARTGSSSFSTSRPSITSRETALSLDWISSNFVEQQDERPTFDLSDPRARSTFGGVISEEEQRENENLERKGFDKVW
ncbi:MAG: hypothetical protein V5A72_02390, partial [Candidatus Nanohaloarchaea archaeon]